ncbi:DUF6708 domain-containing protein [Pseudomonas sp. HR96]|uniref:DUF6708 domain-containing protein n=1 Tax=Pseudomonas sp. HR96 TaxID=1027966 RepID=UPI002A758DBA|nr:DUF6708 domain-containing protein [Pseudomonas sp. HR96]WPO98921.1 DUF6708 domain-containing protein [Pseudomonas sp. HR96]
MSNKAENRLPFRPFGWKYDLPGPNEESVTQPHASLLSTPNHLDEVYMELPCATLQARGLGVWLTICICPAILFFVMDLLSQQSTPPFGWSHLFLLAILAVGIYMSAYIWRMDMDAPVDEPIRFNRLRRKIYVYRFRHSLNLFNRTKWGVYPAAYDWDAVRAEFCSIYRPMGTGGLVQFVNLAVVDPRTGKILDRLIFAHGRVQGEMYWAMAKLYMQQGPDAVPKFDRPPRDWNNEVHFENIARRFAPRVKWPEVMDIESRSAG